MHFGRGRGVDAEARQHVNPAKKGVGEKSELNDKGQGQISERRDAAGGRAAPAYTVFIT